MRNLTAILLLACLCFTLLGYHLIFHYQLASVKSEMKAFLKNQEGNKDVVQLSFNKNELKQVYWKEDGEEFSYGGEMYDVVAKATKGDTVVIRCIPDKKETSLLNEYKKNNKLGSSNSTIAQLITTQFVLPVDCSLKAPERQIKTRYKDYSSFLQDVASTIVLPPPDVC